jgi:aminopeptidase N
MKNTKHPYWSLYSILLLSLFLFAEKLPSTIGANNMGDSIFKTEGNGGIDISHYDLNLTWNDKNNTIKAKATINITSTQALSVFSLDFHALKITSISIDAKPVAFTRIKDKLIITLAKPIAKESPFQVLIAYKGQPSPLKDSVAWGWQRTAEGVQALSEPISAKNWFPCNNHPKDKANYSFHITVPKAYNVVANGMPQKSIYHSHTTSYHFITREPMASYLTMIAIGHYDREVSTTKSGIPIYNYYFKGMKEKDKQTFQKQAEILDFFSEKFGAYPFSSAGIVASKAESILAYETQTRPFFGTPTSEKMLAHELAHQWFGNLVSLDEWKESWLKEGFASYAAALWFEHKEGKQYMDAWLKGTYESLMGIQRLPKKNMSKMLKAFQMKERILSVEEVTKLIDLGTKNHTNKAELKKALSHLPKEGISSYKLNKVFEEVSFPYFDLVVNKYIDFMAILSGKPAENSVTFMELVAMLGKAPRDVHSIGQIYSSGVYTRGALAIHALRIKIGDKKFFNLLQAYFKKYKNSHANSNDFETLANKISGENLDDFFYSWLEAKLIPDIPEYGIYKKNYAQ